MKKTLLLIASVSLMLSGCASFGRGVAEAIMKPQEKNSGECRVFTGGFDGLEDVIARNEGKVKILTIHGIGKKIPGYSTDMVSSLAFKLGMDTTEKKPKDIELADSQFPDRNLGHLRIYRYFNEDGSRELMFYEYTWAGITEPIKNNLLFDSTDFNAEKRTGLSKIIKEFINETGTDAVIYLGNKEARLKILDGVSQVFCWMAAGSWENLPDNRKASCSEQMFSGTKTMNDYVVITHSLGSQISVDALEEFVSSGPENRIDSIKAYSKNVNVTIYMFANQLPAIAIGKEKPAVTGKAEEYCSPEKPLYNKRFINNTNIVAFSDPNDVLSYAIPPGFENEHMDSRLCPDITNVLVNVAPLSNLFGAMTANPLEAHSNYRKDDRIANLIINGIDNDTPQADPEKGCHIIRTIK